MTFFIDGLETTVVAEVNPVISEIPSVATEIVPVVTDIHPVVTNFHPVMADIAVVGKAALGLCTNGKEQSDCDEYGKFRFHNLCFKLLVSQN